MFIGHTVGNGAGPWKAYLGDPPGVLLGEQKLIQKHGPVVLDLADDPRCVLLRRSASHGNAFPVAGVNAIQLVDDVQHIMAASFFTVGHDVDACPVLVVDRRKSSLVQQSCKFGWPELLLAPVESEANAVEQRSTALSIDVARLRIAADNCG